MVKKDLLIIFFIALIFRLLFLLHPYETGDSCEYRLYALNMIKYHTFSYSREPPIIPSTHRTPVYPLFIAIIYSIFGVKDIFIYVIQALISTVTCLIIYFIALELFHKRIIAFLSGVAVALYPFLSWFVSTVMVETLFAFLLAATLLFIIWGVKTNSWKLFLTGGVLLGLTTLCKPTTQFLLLFIIFSLWFIYSNKELFFRNSLIFFVGFIICILPWTIRNFAITKQIIPITSQGLDNFYLATLDTSVFDDVAQNNFWIGGQRDALLKGYLSTVHNDSKNREVKKEMLGKAILNIKKNPLAFIARRLKCEFFLWAGSNYMIETTWSEAIRKHAYGIIIGKFIITIFLHIFPISMYLFAGWLLRNDWRKYLLVYSIPVYFAILHFPIHIEMRYSMPAYPYILIFCIYALQKVITNKV